MLKGCYGDEDPSITKRSSMVVFTENTIYTNTYIGNASLRFILISACMLYLTVLNWPCVRQNPPPRDRRAVCGKSTLTSTKSADEFWEDCTQATVICERNSCIFLKYFFDVQGSSFWEYFSVGFYVPTVGITSNMCTLRSLLRRSLLC